MRTADGYLERLKTMRSNVYMDPPTADYLAKYIMRREGVSAEDQHRAFRFFSDLLASAHAGVSMVAGVHGGGSPIMERIAITGQYNLKAKKNLAKYLAGIQVKKS